MHQKQGDVSQSICVCILGIVHIQTIRSRDRENQSSQSEVKEAYKVTGYEPGAHYQLKFHFYFNITIFQNLKNPNSLLIKTQYHQSNLTMSAREPALAFIKTKWGNISLLTYLSYETWKETISLILEAMDAYDIVTSEEPEPPPIYSEYYDWKI